MNMKTSNTVARQGTSVYLLITPFKQWQDRLKLNFLI